MPNDTVNPFDALGAALLADSQRATISVPVLRRPDPVDGQIQKPPPPPVNETTQEFKDALAKLGDQLSEVRKDLAARGVPLPSPPSGEQYAAGDGATQKAIMAQGKAISKAIDRAMKGKKKKRR